MAEPTIDDLLAPDYQPAMTSATKALVLALRQVSGNLGGLTTSRTASAVAAVADGTSVAGKKSVTFIAGPTFSGAVLGVPLAPGAQIGFEAQYGDTIGAIAYTRSSGTLYIVYLT